MIQEEKKKPYHHGIEIKQKSCMIKGLDKKYSNKISHILNLNGLYFNIITITNME